MAKRTLRGCDIVAAVVHDSRQANMTRVVRWKVQERRADKIEPLARKLISHEGRVVAVIYETMSHSNQGQFSVCAPIKKVFEISDGRRLASDEEFYLVVEDARTRQRLFEDLRRLSSGNEIAGAKIRDAISASQLIRVTASLPARPYRFTTLERSIPGEQGQYHLWQEAVGTTYASRREVQERHGVQVGGRGSICAPPDSPFILLFTQHTDDQHDETGRWTSDGVFLYAGESQTDDLELAGGNRQIATHTEAGKALRLFEWVGKDKVYRYDGEFTCSGWNMMPQTASDGTTQHLPIFSLIPVSTNPAGALPLADVAQDSWAGEEDVALDELRRRAYEASAAASKMQSKDARRILYERSAKIRRYVLARAGGTCEACGEVAPFKRPDGTPYLEPHHVKMMSEGGPDHPKWVGAVCPNCHREMHYGDNGHERNERLRQWLRQREDGESPTS